MRLTGKDLLDKIACLGDAGASAQAKECGYVAINDDGREIIDFTEFYQAVSLAEMERNPSSQNESDSQSLEFIEEQPDLELQALSNELLDLCDSINKSIPMNGSRLRLVRVTYNGCGDSGEVDILEYFFDPPQEADSLQLLPKEIIHRDQIFSKSDYDLKIKEDAFAISYNSQGSWFNDAGGSGCLIIDLDGKFIGGFHAQNEYQDEDFGHIPEDITPYFIHKKNY
jgi:hypothetical protein